MPSAVANCSKQEFTLGWGRKLEFARYVVCCHSNDHTAAKGVPVT